MSQQNTALGSATQQAITLSMLVSALLKGRMCSCADKESFDKGKEVQIALKAGHHRPASGTPLNWFRWRADDDQH